MGSLAKGSRVGVVWRGPGTKLYLVTRHGQTGWVLGTELAGVGAAKVAVEAGGKSAGAGDAGNAARGASHDTATLSAAPARSGVPARRSASSIPTSTS